MPHTRTKHPKRLDPRGPLVFGVAALGPGSAETAVRTVPAPADMGSGLVRIPAGADIELDVRLEGVTEGVLATALVTAPLAGECARCLEPFAAATTVRFQELFALDAETAGPDGYVLAGDLLDLEPALRDALVLDLPLSPLCAEDCQGLCAECGARLADAGPGHGHPRRGVRWAALKDFRADGPDQDPGGDEAAPGGTPVPDDE